MSSETGPNRGVERAGRIVRASGVLAAAAVAAAAAGAGCRERGRPDPNVHMVISHERAIDPASSGQGGPGFEAPHQLDVPPEVSHLYPAIRLGWKDRSAGTEGVVEVPLGAAAGTPLAGSALAVKADAFLPAFAMDGSSITSEGVEPTNPAARIEVYEKGIQIFGGWIFARFPDVHPFTHARFELRLEGGVRKGAPEGGAAPK